MPQPGNRSEYCALSTCREHIRDVAFRDRYGEVYCSPNHRNIGQAAQEERRAYKDPDKNVSSAQARAPFEF